MMTLRFSAVDRSQLHRCFLEAFADYAMDASGVKESDMRIREAKNGVDYDVSVGAYDGDRLVAFTLIGLGDWEGAPAAFDAGTGIVPEFRGEGLAKHMFDHALPELGRRGVKRFLLEVLQSNAPAIRAYEKAGFAITREFACLSCERAKIKAVGDSPFTIREIDRATVLSFEDQIDWTPSWENSFQAIERIPADLMLYGAYDGELCAGIIAYSPTFNWILSLVVHRDQRRRSAATALLRHLHSVLPSALSSIKITNIDASDDAMPACLECFGFEHWVDQYEMVRNL